MLQREEFFKNGDGITYNDFNIMPGYIDFLHKDVNLRTKLTTNISLNLPIVSSPMDTVTEDRMAIALALMGGIGIIHYNNTINKQVEIVKKVKRFQNGIISDPIVLEADNTIADVDAIKEQYGFSSIPIIDDKRKLIGIVTSRDIDFVEDRNTQLQEVMVPLCDMSVVEEYVIRDFGINSNNVKNRILKENIGKLPVVDENGRLVALITRTDLKKLKDFPNSTTDNNGRLRVGAAISTHEEDKHRLEQLVAAGIDVVVIDAAQGYSKWQIELIRYIKDQYRSLQVIAGNVVTPEAAKFLIMAGADGIRLGMGGGAICTTQETMACGRAQASAIYDVWNSCKDLGIPIIADGGISTTGSLVKALACGASVGMMGGMFAGTDESPGEFYTSNGVRVKTYRGMASAEAMKDGGGKRYFSDKSTIRVSQGVSGTVVDKGSVYNLIPYIEQSLKLAFQDIGVRNIGELHGEEIYFERRTTSAQIEGGIHDLHNYRR